MTELVPPRILKEGERRSVRLETAVDGSRSVVKRFSSLSVAGATLDRARAAREHRMLSELSLRGLAVPRPLALEHKGEAWEVRMEWIDGAVALSEVFAGRAPWPVAPRCAARSLGRLLAGLHAAGVDHPDLHAGNALIAPSGATWAIDFHKARRVRRLRPKTMQRDLVSLAAGVRELVPPAFRARFFLAWRRALPRELAAPFSGALESVAELERLARQRRIDVVRRRRARWMRHGTACVAVREPFEGFARRGIDAELVRRIAAEASARKGEPRAELAKSSLAGADVLLVSGLSRRDTRGVWCSSARLEEHALPAARPLALALGARPWVALELPRGSAPCIAPAVLRTRRSLRSLGTLCAMLADRELVPQPCAGPLFWRAASGQVWIGAVGDLQHEPRAGNGVDTVRALALAGLSVTELSARERAAFAVGILAGVQLGRAARARLRGDLRHG